MIVGLISDTHGLLRPEAVAALAGVDSILHAGDVGDPAVLEALGAIAPVQAVAGNVDPASAWPHHLLVELEGVRLLVIHQRAHVDAELLRLQPNLVIYGHSHKPALDLVDGVTFLNPGAAGPRRFSLPISVVRLHIDAGQWRAEFVNLLDEGELP